MNVQDAVTVITGASSGIGRATALACAESGGTVVVSARRTEALERLASECRELGGDALAVTADVTDPDTMNSLARTAIEKFGRIDVWFNNAGVTVAGNFDEIPPEDYRRVIETNLFGVINGTRSVLPYMREQGSGIIINHSSVIGKFGASQFSAYSTSKAAIIGFSESLRQELRGTGINVCLVLPAAIDTPIYNQAANFSGLGVKPVEPIYPAELAAREVIGLIKRPRAEVYVGNAGRAGSFARKVTPFAASDRAIGSQWEQDHFQPQPAEPSSGNLYEPDSNPEHAATSGGWPVSEGSNKPYVAAAVAATAIPAAYLLRNRTKK
jgi:NAD(P)-dependent dehydrogenase (short-subunit alcohol dehydrogenase family)